MRSALNGKENQKIHYISGAGNSSVVLDRLEALGVKDAFPGGYLDAPVSSVKSMVGEAIALGGLRMVANVLSLENQFIPPTINYRYPDPDCDLPYVTHPRFEKEIRTVLHLGISPESCFASILIGAPWT
jgi:3-oxoacyl-[acyl-carrier-protein] synthase II